jgi:hypothetical protein
MATVRAAALRESLPVVGAGARPPYEVNHEQHQQPATNKNGNRNFESYLRSRTSETFR